MRMSNGVEWAAHCCLLLDWLGPDAVVPSAKLAAAFELPAPYLHKHLQPLVHAGILRSVRGVHGGFMLDRPLERISLLDVVRSIEGDDGAFRCTEIRRCGLGANADRAAWQRPCEIAASMYRAEQAWNAALATRSLADIRDDTETNVPGVAAQTRAAFAAL